MPRAPSYNPATSGAAPVSARLQAPQFVESGLGQGLERAGQAVGQFASEMDALQAQHDDTVARQQVLALQPQLSEQMTQFKVLQGGNAVDGRQQAIDGIAKLRDQGASALKSPRAQRIFNERFGAMYAAAVGDINGHAIEQAAEQRKGVLAGEREEALNALSGLGADPKAFSTGLAVLRQKAQAEADFAGMGEGSGAFVKKTLGRAVGASVQNLLADNKVELAQALYNAHRDEMTFEQSNAAYSALQKPLHDRRIDGYVDAAMGMVSPQGGVGAHDDVGAVVQSTDGGPLKYSMPVSGGRITDHDAQHIARGSRGLDIAGPLNSAIHPVAEGVVIPWQADAKKSGHYVAVQHPDGHITTYSHMGPVSVKVGDEVTPDTVLGTIGLTGHTTGPHVHVRAYDKDRRDIDPETLFGKGPQTGVVGSPSAARNYDQAAVINNIKRQGLSPEDERETIARARQRMQEAEGLLNDQYQDANEQANKWVNDYIASHGGEYPSENSIPASITARMNPADVSQQRAKLAEAAKGKRDEATRKEQDWTALSARLRMFNDPQGFMTADIPKQYMGKVSASDFAQLVTDQARMRQDASKPQAWEPFSDTASALAQYSTFNGLNLQDQDKAAALQTMKAQAEQFVQDHKRPPSSSEWYGIAQRATRTVQTPGAFWGTNSAPLYRAAPSQADRDSIIAAWRRANNSKGTPSDQVIMEAWRAAQAGSAIQ